VYSSVWRLSCLSIYTVFVSAGLICKAYSLGLVHFTGKTLSVSLQKFYSSNGFDPMGLGMLQVVLEQRFCDLSHAFHIDV